MLSRWTRRMGRLLASPHTVWALPLLAIAMLAFGLDLGRVLDDHVHRAALEQHPDLPSVHRAPADLFRFVDGDPERLRGLMAEGIWPWWSAPELRLSFWRPVSGWSHALDYRLWPDRPWLMHLHSLAIFALAVGLLTVLYRRLLPSAAVAGLAGLIYLLDDSLALPAIWLANRNAVLALVFGVACLLTHDRSRRHGSRGATLLAPGLLLLAVLANEGAVAIGGYLLAYAVFLDPGARRRAVFALGPCAAVGVGWALAYRAGHYGAQASGGYIDPVGEPLRFLSQAVERAPTLLWGWWGLPPADLFNILPASQRSARLAILLGLLLVIAWLLRPILAREPAARFLGAGMLLSLVPACSTYPSNRLLVFVGIGGAGLAALLLVHLRDRVRETTRVRRLAALLLLALGIVIHGVAAPVLSRLMMQQMAAFDDSVRSTATSLVEAMATAPSGATAVVVTTPSAFVSLGAGVVATLVDEAPRRRQLVLAPGIHETEVERVDLDTLVIRPRGGFLRRADAGDPPGITRPVIDPAKTLLPLDHLFRDLERLPFATGDRVALDGVTVEVVEHEGGRPTVVAFHFEASLDDPRWRWLAWRSGGYLPFEIPPIGSRVTWPDPGLGHPRSRHGS